MTKHYSFRILLCPMLLLCSMFVAQHLKAQTTDQSLTFAAQSGTFVLHASVVFTDGDADGMFDASFNLSDRKISAWSDYACVLAFYADGMKVRNSSGTFVYENQVLPVSGEQIDIWYSVDVAAKTYSVSVKKPGGAITQISNAGYFRYAATYIDRWSCLHNASAEPDYLTVSKSGLVSAIGEISADLPGIKDADRYSGHVVADEGAWCWFADPRALHYENEAGTINSTYLGYIDIHGQIKATQHDFLTGRTNEVSIRTYFQPDDHNNPTFLVLPDERIMIFYSRHTDEACFYYRVSQKPGDITTLGAEKRLVTANNTTYPSPFILSDDPTHIYLCWRGIGWHPTIGQLSIPDVNDNCSFTWGPYQMVQSTGARPYAKYASNGKDKIYMTYTTAHPDNQNPNYVYFNYVDVTTKQLKDINGTFLSNIADGTFAVAATNTYTTSYPATVVDNANMRDWVWQITMDSLEKPIIAMVRINAAKTSHDYYYVKWTGSEWRKTFLCNAGGQFHQTSGTEMCYSGGMSIDEAKPNEIYCSLPVSNLEGDRYEIVKYTVANDGTVADTVYITKNSKKNNERPYIIPGSQNSPLRLVWMNGDYYYWIISSTYPNAFPTTIRSHWALPQDSVRLDSLLLKKETFDGSISGTARTENGVLITSAATSATLSATSSSKFTIALTPYLYADAYYGTILTMGNLTYGIDKSTQKPYVKIGNTTYAGSNLLGTSDVWKTVGTGTGGNWPTPTKLTYFGLALTYENGLLRTYINGLIDQSIAVEGLTLADVNIGGFIGWTEECRIYTRALLQGEIKALAKEAQACVLDAAILAGIGLDALDIPDTIYTDIPLRTTSINNTVSWSSSNMAVLSNTGIVTLPENPTVVQLTATIASKSKNFDVTVMPRDISKNMRCAYFFETADKYTKDDITYVTDHSGNGKDVAIYGNAAVDGTLNLTANTATDFNANGHAVAPTGLLTDLRSYTFALRVKPASLASQPRLYDFGSGAYNSVLGRANTLIMGVKYDGGSTAMVNASQQLSVGTETFLAFTFNAGTHTSKIYFDGTETASGTNITAEPYQIEDVAADVRNYIGRTQWWSTSEAANNIDYCGTIDDFYLFDIALNAAEIIALGTPSSLPNTTSTVFSISPNPVRCGQSIQINYPAQSDKVCVELLDVLGKSQYTGTLPSGTVLLESPKQKGIYLLRITEGNTVSTEKIIVE